MKQSGIIAIPVFLLSLVILGGIAYLYSVRSFTGDMGIPSVTPVPAPVTNDDVIYCGGIANIPCPTEGYSCTLEGNYPDAATVCVPGQNLPRGSSGCVVGGCSSELCHEAGEDVVSPCVWRDEYACYKSATCSRQSNGECDWTPTSDLLKCLGG